MDRLERLTQEGIESASELMQALDEAEGDVTPPQTVGREVIEWMDFAETGITYEELPKPTIWRVLVFPKQPKTMSKGGIALPSAAQSVEAHLNYIGQVVALGPLAGKSEKFLNPEWVAPPMSYRVFYESLINADTPEDYERRHRGAQPDVPRYLWDVKVGDWIVFGRYSGQITEYKGFRLMFMNDDDIVSVIKDPSGLTVYL